MLKRTLTPSLLLLMFVLAACGSDTVPSQHQLAEPTATPITTATATPAPAQPSACDADHFKLPKFFTLDPNATPTVGDPAIPTPTPDPRPQDDTPVDSASDARFAEFVLIGKFSSFVNTEHIRPGNAHTPQLTNAFWDIDVESLIIGDPGLDTVAVYNQIAYDESRSYETTIYGLNATVLPGESAVYFLNEQKEPETIPGAAGMDRVFWVYQSMFPIVDGKVCTQIDRLYSPEPVEDFLKRISN